MLFYASWDWLNFETPVPRFFIHFTTVTSINYLFVILLEKYKSKSVSGKIISTAVFLNVLNLGFFKYFYFAIEVAGVLVGHPEWKGEARGSFDIILPIAISFYTFQTIAFLVDKYRGEIPDHTSYVDFTLFIFFFPQQLAGPILKAKEFLPRLKSPVPMDEERIWMGLYFIGLGIIKKGVFADSIAYIISPVFASPSDYSAQSLALSLLGFLFQLWGDFAGYSDMAVGCGKLLGFDLPQNFNRPFYSQGFAEMWERWHITLSRFLREYIYFPMGGSRVVEWRAAFNTGFTMVLAGLWHGANWTYLYWGVVIAISLIVERYLLNRIPFWKEKQIGWKRSLKIGVILLFWLYLGLIFRSNRVEDIPLIWNRIFSGAVGQSVKWEELLFMPILMYILQYFEYKEEFYTGLLKRRVLAAVSLSTILLFVLAELSNKQVQFLYFQF